MEFIDFPQLTEEEIATLCRLQGIEPPVPEWKKWRVVYAAILPFIIIAGLVTGSWFWALFSYVAFAFMTTLVSQVR